MKATLNFLIVILVLFCSCKQEKLFDKILNKDAITSQFFNVNKNRDTTLVTKNGMVLQIKKETFESDSTTIKLEIKEALTNEQIVLAGLTTLSGKQALSSGGMLYINAAEGYKASIKKEIEVLVPTKNYNADMSVYEGKEVNGKIDWINPVPLPNDTLQKQIKLGEQIFKANCNNCHRIDKDYTGPAVAGVSTRYSKQWIYDFMKNPAGMIAKNREAKALFNKWKPTVMTGFPALTHNDIDAILAYVDTKSKRKFAPTIIPEYNGACEDSCMAYLQALEDLRIDKENLEAEKPAEDFFTLDRTIPIPPQNNTTELPSNNATTPISEKVVPNKITATFYTINIKTFGWVNIDILLKNYDALLPSELFVLLQAKYEAKYSVMLIIPSLKVFVEGGKLKENNMYGFDETNGKISLPQNTPCIILSFAEVNDKLIFGKANFTAGLKQTVDISFTETTKEGLAAEIKTLDLDGVTAEIKATEYGKNKKALEKSANEIEKLKPKNCDCNLQEPVMADSSILKK